MPQERYSLLYQFFKTQIEFGYYRKGDTLPTMELLRELYHAAQRTVRSAYLQLQKEGYVSMASGRRTLVMWDATPQQSYARAQDYYLAREEGFRDVEAAARFFLLPLLQEACASLEEQDLDEIGEIAVMLASKSFYVSFFCARQMLVKLGNKLMLDLYDELAAYYQFPHALYKRVNLPNAARQLAALSQQVAGACRRRDRAGLYETYCELQDLLHEIMQAYLRGARQRRPAQEQVPFTWQVYRARPQVCYSLAAHLCGRVYIGKLLAPGSLLPSYGALAAEYGVSVSTVRRAVNLVERLGVVTPKQGVGTRVTCREPSPDCLQDKMVQKLPPTLCEALQVLRLAFDGMAAQLFPQKKQHALHAAAMLREKQAQGPGFVPFFCCMSGWRYENKNPAMGQILEKLYEALLLGLPLVQSRAADFSAARLDTLTTALAKSLETGGFALFRDSLWELTELVETAALPLAQTAAQKLNGKEAENVN